MGDVRATRGRRLAGLATVAVTVLALATAIAPAAAAEGAILGSGNPTAIEGSYIVVFNDASGVDALAGALAATYGTTVDHTYRHALRGFAGRMSESAARRLAADPAVDHVEQDAVVSIAATQPNPPSWGLDRIDQRDLPLDSSYTYPNTASNARVNFASRSLIRKRNDLIRWPRSWAGLSAPSRPARAARIATAP